MEKGRGGMGKRAFLSPFPWPPPSLTRGQGAAAMAAEPARVAVAHAVGCASTPESPTRDYARARVLRIESQLAEKFCVGAGLNVH